MREPRRNTTKHIRLPADQDLARLILGAIMSERSSWGWKLVSASKKPGGDVAVLEWDTTEAPRSPAAHIMTGSVAVMPEA